MAYEHKDDSGSLFRNEKQKDTQPDYKGSALIGGTEFWVSGWVNKTSGGESYLSIKFEAKEERPAREPEPQQDGDDGGLPF